MVTVAFRQAAIRCLSNDAQLLTKKGVSEVTGRTTDSDSDLAKPSSSIEGPTCVGLCDGSGDHFLIHAAYCLTDAVVILSSM